MAGKKISFGTETNAASSDNRRDIELKNKLIGRITSSTTDPALIYNGTDLPSSGVDGQIIFVIDEDN